MIIRYNIIMNMAGAGVALFVFFHSGLLADIESLNMELSLD